MGVAEVARVLQRDPQLNWVARCARRRLREELADVTHLRGERLRSFVVEEPGELFQVRAATGRVHDDEVDVVERVDQSSRELLALFEPARMDGKGAAAALGRSDDLEAVRREDASRGRVDVGEDRALDAAGEQADASASHAGRGRECRNLALAAPAWSDLDEGPEALRQRGGAAERREPERGAHPPRVREEAEEKPADKAVAERAVELVFDGCARALDQPVVAHARGARGDAGHAAETAVEVLRDRSVQRNRAVEARVHEVDAAARRVHLLAPEHVRRARREAEATVDAVGRVLADHNSTPRGSSSRRIRSTSASTTSWDGPCDKL